MKYYKIKLLSKYILLFLLLPLYAFSDVNLDVVVTSDPIYYITKYIGGNKAKVSFPKSIDIDEHGHEKHYLPSEAKKIRNADLVVIIDEHFDGNTVKKIVSDNLMTLSELDGLKIYEYRGLDEHLGDEHHDGYGHKEHKYEDEHHNENDNHAHGNYDWHIWLDIDNLKLIANAIVAKLTNLNPQNSGSYLKNKDNLIQSLDKLDNEIQAKLSQGKYSVFILHDAYQYFERYFNIESTGYIFGENTLTLDNVSESIELIENENIKCVFSHPHIGSKKINFYKKNTDARVFIVNPLLVEGDSNDKPSIIKLVSDIANHYASCK